MTHCHSLNSLSFTELYGWCLLNVTVTSSWTRYYKTDINILCQAPPSICLPSCLSDVKDVTKSPRPSPFILAYCKQSKTGGGNGLGTRLLCTSHVS